MWIFTTNGFYSIVKSDEPGKILVRSRFHGDIEALIPGAEVSETPERDYMYRTVVPIEDVIKSLIMVTQDIDYPNFKDAVLDDQRHPAYGNVWSVMYNAGDNRIKHYTIEQPLWMENLRAGLKKKKHKNRHK